MMPSGVTFFFEPSYLLARDKIVVPPFDAPTRQTTMPETYQPSDCIPKGRHLTDWLLSNEVDIETVFFSKRFILIVQFLRKGSHSVCFFVSSDSDLQCQLAIVKWT